LENLFSEVRKISLGHQSFKLTDFIEYLNILINYNILIKMKEGVSLIDSIHLMTAHKSKGLEFDYVYVIGANDGHWGNRRSVKHFYIPNIDGTFSSGSEPYENEDERRLFYVALTRAKKEVILTYSRENFDKDYKIASQFVEEIDKEYIDEIDTKEIEKKLSLGINKYSPKINKSISIKNKEYLRNLFLDQGFSVTAINNYIGDPWDYFFISLVRIPGMPSTAQEYGTAMHQSLSLKNPTKKKILDAFKKNLSKKTLNRGDYEKYLKRGQDALSGYYKMYSKSLRASGLNEIDIAGVFTEVLWQKPIKGSQTQKINILLKGKIDRLEFLDNGKIRIIDYKTGAPKSRNWIEGKTKNSNGNYKRQLVFYKLLLKKLETQSTRHSDILKNVRMSGMEGVIDFIEPNEKGEHKREIFNITDEEVMELEKEIQKIALEILNFKFWKVKPKQNSKYGDLVEMLK
jgi:DNA helicase II / ATP-dependent DNA helicase PcrA